MNNNGNLIAFGELSFCLKNQQFFRAEQEVRVEPKVCELFNYLYQNRDRYVSLTELHAQLWRGRIVSDTAVRRTISKLRSILADENSKDGYIRSLSKRGYKLVIEDITDENHIQEHVEDQIEEHINLSDDTAAEALCTDVVAVPDSAVQHPHPEQPLSVNIPVQPAGTSFNKYSWRNLPLKVWCYVLLLFVVLFSVGSFISRPAYNVPELKLTADKVQVFALSPNKQFIVYSADLTGLDGFQLFLKNLHDGFVQQLTKGNHKFISAGFTRQGNSLLFISWNQNKYQLSQIDLQAESAQAAPVKVLFEQQLPLTNLYIDQQQDDILLTLYNSQQTAAIYQFDPATLATKAITFPRDSGTYDEFPRLNKQTGTFYYVRTLANANPTLIVQDYLTGKLLKQITLPKGRLRDLQWSADRKQMILLYTDRIIVLQLASGELKEVDQSLPNSTYLQLQPWDKNKFLLLENKTEQRQFYLEQQAANEPLLNIPASVYSVKFSADPKLLYLSKKQTQGSGLTVIDRMNGEERQLLQTKGTINNLLVSPDGNLLHLSIDERLAVFNQQTASLYYVTSEAQQVSGLGEFSHDGRYLLYGEKFGGNWRIVKYDLQTQQSTIWQTNYQVIKRQPQGFVLQDPQGNLFQLATPDAEPVKLAAIALELDEEFQLRYPKVYQRQMRQGRYQLFAFDLLTGNEEVIEPQTMVSFDVSADKTAVITQKISYQSSLREILIAN